MANPSIIGAPYMDEVKMPPLDEVGLHCTLEHVIDHTAFVLFNVSVGPIYDGDSTFRIGPFQCYSLDTLDTSFILRSIADKVLKIIKGPAWDRKRGVEIEKLAKEYQDQIDSGKAPEFLSLMKELTNAMTVVKIMGS